MWPDLFRFNRAGSRGKLKLSSLVFYTQSVSSLSINLIKPDLFQPYFPIELVFNWTDWINRRQTALILFIFFFFSFSRCLFLFCRPLHSNSLQVNDRLFPLILFHCRTCSARFCINYSHCFFFFFYLLTPLGIDPSKIWFVYCRSLWYSVWYFFTFVFSKCFFWTQLISTALMTWRKPSHGKVWGGITILPLFLFLLLWPSDGLWLTSPLEMVGGKGWLLGLHGHFVTFRGLEVHLRTQSLTLWKPSHGKVWGRITILLLFPFLLS